MIIRWLCLLSLLGLAASPLHAADRPNILFILVDDQSPLDLKMYNPQSILDSPVLDRLAARGVVFDGPTTWVPSAAPSAPPRGT